MIYYIKKPKYYPIYELHVKGSCYTIRKANQIVKYLDGAYGHKKCLNNALKWVKKQKEKTNDN